MNVIDDIKSLNIEIGKKMFRIGQGHDRPSPLQFQIMDFLIKHQEENVCQKDIEKYLKLSKATVSKGLLAMENKGIVKRVTALDDGRSKNIIFTEDALNHFEKMKAFVERLNQDLTKDIEEEELQIFVHVIEKMIVNLKEDQDA